MVDSVTTTFTNQLATLAKRIGTADRAASDAVVISSGNASVGDSGAIVLRPGTAVGLRGSIILDGVATIGGSSFPTSTGTSGQWMVADGAGALAWTSPEESGAIPAGTIMPFAGRTCPTGWFFCDGAEKSRTTYARLWNALKNAGGTAGVWDTCKKNESPWGNWDAPDTDNFRLPDLRALFIRGAGTNQAGVTTALAVALDDTTSTSGLVGTSTNVSVSGNVSVTGTVSVTGSASSSGSEHGHTVQGGTAAGTRLYWTSSGNGTTYTQTTGFSGGAHSHSVSASGTPTLTGSNTMTGTCTPQLSGSPETRPDCVGVNYIIKY